MTRTKEELIQEFEELKAMEAEAHDFYLKVVADPEVTDEGVKTALQSIADEETRHVELVEQILTVIKNNL